MVNKHRAFGESIAKRMAADDGPLFQCRQCGKCCSSLRSSASIGPYEFGLALLPFEKNLFPSEDISPYEAMRLKGTKPRGIFSYQLKKEICPKLNNSNCTIYTSRPLACRKYPINYLMVTEKGGIRISVDTVSCPEAQPNNTFPAEMIAAAAEDLSRSNSAWSKAGIMYDLKSESWVPAKKVRDLQQTLLDRLSITEQRK